MPDGPTERQQFLDLIADLRRQRDQLIREALECRHRIRELELENRRLRQSED